MGNIEIAASCFALLAFLAGALRAYQKFWHIAWRGEEESPARQREHNRANTLQL